MAMRVLHLDDFDSRAALSAGLPAMGDGWDFHGLENPRQALLALAMEPFDAVVADQAIAYQGEPTFMERVRDDHPDVVRILLHGRAKGEINLNSVGLAHQALAKPCSAAEVCHTIERAVRLGDLFLTREFHKQIASIGSLPTPPATYRALVQEFQRREVSIDRIVGIMAHDLGLTAKILQIVNSAFFGLAAEVKGLKHAITLLGLDLVRALALASGVFNRFEVESMGYLSPDWLADHGTAVGQSAKRIARDLELPDHLCDSALLAGLLHDTGKLINLALFRDKLREAGKLAIRSGRPLHEAERELSGVDHSRVGAHLLALWGLPCPIVEAAAFHHDPLQAGTPTPSVLTAVHIADALAWEELLEGGRPPRPAGGGLDTLYLAALGIEAERLEAWRSAVRPV